MKKILSKVLIVGSFPSNKRKVYGGQVTICKKLLESSLKDDFNLITLDSTQKSNPPPNILLRTFFACVRLFQFYKSILFERPKCVIIFCAQGGSAIEKGVMLLICRSCKIPSLIFPRSAELINQFNRNLLLRFILKRLFKRANYFLCQGKQFQSFAVEKLGFQYDQSPIIENWSASKKLIRVGQTRDYFKNQEKKNIVFIGWVEETKGVLDLLDAISILKKSCNKFSLIVIGGGTASKKCLNKVNEHNISNFVNFIGWKTNDEIYQILKRCHIFVLPSWFEGLPNAMIESMAAGLAVVVTNVGVIPDYVINNKHGIVIPPRDPEALSNALECLLEDPKRLKKIAKNGHNLASFKFGGKSISLLKKIIKKAIEEESSLK